MVISISDEKQTIDRPPNNCAGISSLYILVMSKDSGNEHLAFVPISINLKGLQFLISLTLSVSKSETDLALLESSLNSFDLINLDIKEVSNLLISG